MIKGGLQTSPKRNLFVHGGKEANGGGVVFFWNNTLIPDLESTDRAIGFQGTSPKYWNGTSWAAFGGGSGFTTWDELYANDKSLAISSTTLTFSLTHLTNDGLTLTSGAGTGDLIHITNSGTGADIAGTSDTWSVSKAGAAVFTAITGCDDLTAAANLGLEATAAGTITIGGTSSGAIDIGTGGGAITLASAVACSGALTVATGITVADGANTFTDNSNVAKGLVFINNTVTTYGNASDAGPVHFSSTSLTTGALVTLSLSDTALAGGYYLRGWEQDGAAAAWSIGENGAIVLAGSASGTDVITCTAGDVTVTSGDVTISEGSLVVVNTANESALTITADSVTTGVVVDINADGVTSGTLLHLDTSVDTFTGKYIDCYDGEASDFTVGLAGATVIAGTASGTDVLTLTKGDITLTNGDVTLTNGDLILTANSSLITFTGTGANGGVIGNMKNHATSALSGTAKTVEISIGGTPYYFSVVPTKA